MKMVLRNSHVSISNKFNGLKINLLSRERYFIERSNQEAKSELGWDELQAHKYRAWEHRLALTILASWFVAQTKFEWARDYPRDPALLQRLEPDQLPALSVANVRLFLRAVMPLQRLNVKQATD